MAKKYGLTALFINSPFCVAVSGAFVVRPLFTEFCEVDGCNKILSTDSCCPYANAPDIDFKFSWSMIALSGIMSRFQCAIIWIFICLIVFSCSLLSVWSFGNHSLCFIDVITPKIVGCEKRPILLESRCPWRCLYSPLSFSNLNWITRKQLRCGDISINSRERVSDQWHGLIRR